MVMMILGKTKNLTDCKPEMYANLRTFISTGLEAASILASSAAFFARVIFSIFSDFFGVFSLTLSTNTLRTKYHSEIIA